MPGIIHVVQIAFQNDADNSEIDKVLQDLGNLQQTCLKATTKEPYVKSVRWGRDVSPEGAQNGYTHMFVIEFATVEDRDYYLNDLAHVAVADALMPLKQKVQVLDIEF